MIKRLLAPFRFLALLFPATLAAAEFYVSPDGDDTAAGTRAQPFATVERARDAIRAHRAIDPRSARRIVMRGGTYRLDRTLVLQVCDGGVEVVAAAGEQPILSGAVPLPGGWQRTPHDVPRLPEHARGRVWVATVPEEWPEFRALFAGNRPLPRACTGGLKQLKQPPADGPAIDERHLYLPVRAVHDIAECSGAELVVVPSQPWVMNILPIVGVDRTTGLVRTAVPATYSLEPPQFGRFPGGTAWIENVLEALDEPGEWVLDMRARRLYLWPPDGQDPGADVVAPRLTELVRVEGEIDYDGPSDTPVRGVAFRGLTFTQGDRWPWETGKTGWGLQHDWEMFDRPTALLRFRGGESCTVERCRFIDSGSAGVRLDLFCQKISVAQCEIAHLGGAGVLLAGYGIGTKDVNRDNAVTDCHVHHVGRLLWHSAGIWAWQSGHNRIEHNHVHHTPYAGILVTGRTVLDRTGKAECSRAVRWREAEPVLGEGPADWWRREPLMHARDNLVAHNDLHHCMEKLGDGNAIYVSGAGAGNRILNNFIHDIPASNMNAAIRCDDDQHETTIENNVVTRVCGEGLTWKGRTCVRNNIVYDIRSTMPDGTPCFHRRGYLLMSGEAVRDSVVERNLVVSCSAGQPLLYERVPAMPGGQRLRKPSLLGSCAADCNLYFNTAESGWGRKHLDAQRAFGIEQHSIEADPQFHDPAQDDFRLQPDSPARALGFQDIDISTVGPRHETARADHPRFVVLNRGMRGYSVEKVSQAWPRILNQGPPPAAVVLLIGTNDMINSAHLTPLETFRERYESLVDALHESAKHVVVVTLPPCVEEHLFRRHKRELFVAGSPNDRIGKANMVIREVAAEKGCTLVDLSSVFVPGTYEEGNPQGLLVTGAASGRPDGVHPNARGARRIGEAVAERVASLGLTGGAIVCLGDSITHGGGLAGEGTAEGETYPAVVMQLLNGS